MPKLKVQKHDDIDVYKDIVRIHEDHRNGVDGKKVGESRICLAKVGAMQTYVIMRGNLRDNTPVIRMDEITRRRLGVDEGKEYEFEFRPTGVWGTFLWAITATETAYRVAAHLAVLGAILGLLSVALGAWSIYLTLRASFSTSSTRAEPIQVLDEAFHCPTPQSEHSR